jgi:pimeloyl-ACP methyl ester carboxylesterase
MGAIRSILRGAALAGAAVAGGALAVTARSILATPQPLASALEGEGHIFRFREGDVFYKVRGPAGAQPILLLHSIHLGASAFEWRKNFSALGENFRVYAPDLPGFGLSDRPAIDYTADLYINLITDFARDVIARPAMVVARGQSAAFATRAACLDSQLFSRLVFISPSGIVPTPAAERHELRAQPGQALRGMMRQISETSAGQVPYALLTTKPALSLFIARQSYANPEQVTPDLLDYLFATTHQYGGRFAPLAFMSGKLDRDVASDFAALKQPVLLVWGREDAINEPLNAENLGRLNPRARLELIAQAGNAVQEEQADEIDELLSAWFLAPPELLEPAHKEQAPFISDPALATPAAQAAPAAPEPARTPAASAQTRPTEPAPDNRKTPGGPEDQASVSGMGAGQAGAPIIEAPPLTPEAVATPEAQTPDQAAETPARMESGAAGNDPEIAPSQPQLPAKGATEAAPSQSPAKGAQRRPASRVGTPRAPRTSKAAQPAPQREGTRQERTDPGDKPQPPRSPSGGKKK